MNELYHYGVLGMKWGVRKQEKTSKLRTNSNADKIKDRLWTIRPRQDITNDPKSEKNLIQILDSYGDDKDGAAAYSIAYEYRSHQRGLKGSKEVFKEFVTDVKNGSSTRDSRLNEGFKQGLIQSADIEPKVKRIALLASKAGNGMISKEEREEMVELTAELENYMRYYMTQYTQNESEEEREEREEKEKFNDEYLGYVKADKELMRNLHPYAKIKVENDNGRPVYRYMDPDGFTKLVRADDKEKALETLRKLASHDSNDTYVSTKFGRSRSKTTSASQKPVSVKKGESMTIREFKSMTEAERAAYNKKKEEEAKRKKR